MAKSIANVRLKPSYKAPVVWVLSPSQAFLVGKEKKGWLPVYPADAKKSDGPVGYISKKVLKPAAAKTPLADWGDVRYLGKDVKFYLKRSEKAASGGVLKSGKKIKVGFLKDGWYAVFKPEIRVKSEADALGYIKKELVDLDLPDARIRYAVRTVKVIQKPVATSKTIGVLNPGFRAQVGEEKGGMYALYRIDTVGKKDAPVWGYAWGAFLAPYPKALEKKQMAGIDARNKKPEVKQVMAGAPLGTKTMYASSVLNIRSKADAKALIVDKLEKGEAVTVGAQEGKWYPVFKSDAGKKPKRVGYVYGTYLEAESPAAKKAGEKPAKKAASGPDVVPIKITSKKMVFSENNNRIIFSGNVKVVRLDVTLLCKTLTAHLRPEGDSLTDTQDKIKRIVAQDDVKVFMKKRKGDCDRLTYDVADAVIIMEGNAKLKDGPNLIQGDKIKFFIKENRSEVVGGNKPIEAIFYTPKDVAP